MNEQYNLRFSETRNIINLSSKKPSSFKVFLNAGYQVLIQFLTSHATINYDFNLRTN